MANQGYLMELQSRLPHGFNKDKTYLKMIEVVDCKKERPKYFSK